MIDATLYEACCLWADASLDGATAIEFVSSLAADPGADPGLLAAATEVAEEWTAPEVESYIYDADDYYSGIAA